jgi:hypothetical protein
MLENLPTEVVQFHVAPALAYEDLVALGRASTTLRAAVWDARVVAGDTARAAGGGIFSRPRAGEIERARYSYLVVLRSRLGGATLPQEQVDAWCFQMLARTPRRLVVPGARDEGARILADPVAVRGLAGLLTEGGASREAICATVGAVWRRAAILNTREAAHEALALSTQVLRFTRNDPHALLAAVAAIPSAHRAEVRTRLTAPAGVRFWRTVPHPAIPLLCPPDTRANGEPPADTGNGRGCTQAPGLACDLERDLTVGGEPPYPPDPEPAP